MLPQSHISFIADLHSRFKTGAKTYLKNIQRIGADNRMPANDRYLMEVAELAWTWYYRAMVADSHKEGQFGKSVYDKVVSFYKKSQPTFSSDNSTKRVFQQFSTSAPVSFAAAWYIDREEDGGQDLRILEPSAGNGLLAHYYSPTQVDVNELEKTRHINLKASGFASVTGFDASEPLPDEYLHAYDAVLTNPPFGSLPDKDSTFGWKFTRLDHIMAAHALTAMKDNGRAAIIIGEWTGWGEEVDKIVGWRPHKKYLRRERNETAFMTWLFRNYYVADIININSKELYKKQGTGFELRLILVDGRKPIPVGYAPNKEEIAQYEPVANTFDELWLRVEAAKHKPRVDSISQTLRMYKEQLRIAMADSESGNNNPDLDAIFEEDDEFGLLDVKPEENPNRVLIMHWEEINTFYKQHQREPQDNKNNLYEYGLYARLRNIRSEPSNVEILKDYDTHGLLSLG